MIELKKSDVVFDKVGHTYTKGDESYSGITSIIHRFVMPDMYAGVSKSLLDSKASHGSIVHDEIQMRILGAPYADEEPELMHFKMLVSEHKLSGLQSEVLVHSDKHKVASSIDIVCDANETTEDGVPMVDLIDIKTTSVLNKEYLQWQLGIYAYMLEAMNEGKVKVRNLYAMHLLPERGELVPVERLDTEHIEYLLNFYVNEVENAVNGIEFVNPLHHIGGDFAECAEEYKRLTADMIDLEATLKSMDAQRTALKKRMVESIKSEEKTSGEHDGVKVTISTSLRKSWDMSTFQSANPKFAERYRKILESGYKTSTTESVRVTVK